MVKIARETYARYYGPTKGDTIRLGDTSLIGEIEHDHTTYGDECWTGAGRVMRDGMSYDAHTSAADGAIDMLVENATVIDPVLGLVKADIGIKDGKIAGVGKAGNPNTQDGVDSNLVCGPNTTYYPAGGLIVTPGGIDVHVHWLSADQCNHALASGAHHHDRRHHGAALRHRLRRPLEHLPDAGGIGSVADQFRLLRPRLVPRSGDHRRAPRRRHHRRQDPRGLRRHAGHHRCLPARLRRARFPGPDPHRHAERVRLLRRHDGGDRRPHHPHVPHGRLRRRPRAGHHPLQRRASLPAVVDQPDQPLHGQRLRRATRHDHGLPPAALRPAGGCGLCREPGAPRHHRGRGRAARYRRRLDVRL